ncbi:unnamed protein product [Paramecium pentaurelia]|uniref:Uncharacterized protein n=1 Tax=Paramecium pentaurelia TaxID=43138 RepID=A0A8S1S4Y3_9CILI|nr:unnamed protein product [Paramecium pentaurelia]
MRPIPWYVRLGIDVTIFTVPILMLASYPRLGTHFLNNRRRKYRRRNFDEIQYRNDSKLSSEEVINFRKRFGFQDLI